MVLENMPELGPWSTFEPTVWGGFGWYCFIITLSGYEAQLLHTASVCEKSRFFLRFRTSRIAKLIIWRNCAIKISCFIQDFFNQLYVGTFSTTVNTLKTFITCFTVEHELGGA